MDQQEQQLIDRIKQAQNVLVTVSASPSVDQLAAAIGLTIALNKLDKHGTAVFSGEVPSTIEFLKPEDTLEKNTDSLRDFIIALDKSKADKLRYKVEDQVVRIFITPYRTSLSQNDLEFSQGDFNVDVVVALGVADQKDLDQAITAHGRILHDATVATVSTAGDKSDLGTINWVDQGASSLSEMMLSLIDGLDKSLLDGQIATALLTGIVATTDRFRNEKTTPETMSVSAELMAAGANQQLIATKLEGAPLVASASAGHIHSEEGKTAEGKPEPGTLAIDHEEVPVPAADYGPAPGPEGEERHETTEAGRPGPGPGPGLLPPMGPGMPGMLPPLPQISNVHAVGEGGTPEPDGPEAHHDQIASPPAYGGVNPPIMPYPEESEPSTEELTLPPMNAPLLSHNQTVLPPSPPPAPPSNDSPFIPQAPLPPQMAGAYAPPVPSEQPLPPMPPAPLTMPAPSIPPAPIAPLAPAVPPPARPAPVPLSPAPFAAPTVPMPEPIIPVGVPPSPSPVSPIQPLPPAPSAPLPAQPAPAMPPAPMAPPVSPASASLIPGETLEEIEAAVRSSHIQPLAAGSKPGAPASAPVLSESSLDDARSAVKAALNSGSGPSSQPLRPIAALNAQPLGPELRPAPLPPPPVANPGFSEPTPGDTPADATLDMPLPSNPFGPGQPMGPPPSGGPGAPPPVPPPFFPPQ